MKKIKFVILLTIFLLKSITSYAQSDISMVTHWYNRAFYNPAFIARTDYWYMFANFRQQWTGVEGAPKVINLQTSDFVSNLNSAFGFSITGDFIGLTSAYNPMLSYAYRIQNKKNWALSMGVSGGVFYRTINGSSYQSLTDNDPTVNYSDESSIKPDANIGFELQLPHFVAGLSSTHLFSINRTDSLFLNTNHRYAYLIYKNNTNSFNYSLGIQMANRENLSVFELNGNIRFKQTPRLYESSPREILELGLSCRSTKQITLMAGFNVTPDLKIGYAYDQSLFSGYYKNGTHEIVLEYRIYNDAASTSECKYNGWYR